jgi:hypothetical protein
MRQLLLAVTVISVVAVALASAGGAAAEVLPGTTLSPAPAPSDPLHVFSTESGEHLALSVDAFASNLEAGGPIKVEKKDAGETVKVAYLFAASTGFSGYKPENGDVTLNGEPVSWEAVNTIESAIFSWNAVANVTSIVKPVVDPASPGLVSFTVAEGAKTGLYDGEILAVVLEDPAVKASRSIILLYGTQATTGDTFHVKLAEGAKTKEPGFAMNLGLGISFSYDTGSEQYSLIHVNEKLLTSSAGGQDDCRQKYEAVPAYASCFNGELMTAGGIGDTNENPPNPAATPSTCSNSKGEPAPRCDDELYSLVPFINEGEEELKFETVNPSNDDNILFGALEVSGAAIVGEGIVLGPTTATNEVGKPHTVTAKVQTETGEPVVGTKVHFEVTSGPNKGLTGESTTNSEGKATFTYTSTKTGTDTIVATFVNKKSETETSNSVTKEWTEQVTGCGAGASAKGVGHAGPIGPEGLNENDNLICPPGSGTETFETTFPNKDHWHLSHLSSAKCETTTGGHVFSGQGTGRLNTKSGYSATFSWEVVGKKVYFSLTIEKEAKVVDSVSHLLLNSGSKENITC